jgi:hypothetical protein
MKKFKIYSSAVLAAMLLLNSVAVCQKVSKIDTIDWPKMEMHCLVAHMTKDGIFTCNFKGTYYPETIYDSTIRKWFIEVKNNDSVFYYRTDVERLYIWNGRPKNQEYGYEWKTGSGSVRIPDKYNGSDTLKIKEQIWKPKDW